MLIFFVRTILVYVLIIFSMRLMGKRQLGELQPSELVTTILVSNLASLPIENPEIPIAISVLPIFLIISIEIVVSLFTIKSHRFAKLISGRHLVIIKKGVIDQRLLKELRISVDDLMESLRMSGVLDIREVELAIIESTGQINVFTKEDMPKEKLFLPIVIDGAINKACMNFLDIKPDYIEKIIKKNNTSLGDVLLLECNELKEIHIVKKELS